MASTPGTFSLCARCARSFTIGHQKVPLVRRFATSTRRRELQAATTTQPATNDRTLAPSRRRQAAIQSTGDLPFTQLPYQCFQEALAYLREDRAEKVLQIEEQRKRIARLENALQKASEADRYAVRRALNSSQRHLEYLKVQADINDPLVKKRFEDGLGDMAKPVYRHLARQKWEAYEKKIVLQRITQMGVLPDVLPAGAVDPSVQLKVNFGGRRVAHGVVVPSTMSERAPTLQIQSFEAGEKLVSIAVVDSDVPNTDTDAFDHRAHILLVNVPITPTSGTVELDLPVDDPSLVLSWLPPTAQNGAPWHRLSVWVLEQRGNQRIDEKSVKSQYTRDNFTLRSFQSKYMVKALGVTMFRTKWDEGTRGVMERHGIQGADIEWRKKAIQPMAYKKKDGNRFR